MAHERNLKLYKTHPHPCSYLADREATTVFLDPDARVDKAVYSRLTLLGFRRSGVHLYRPECGECRQCVPTRIPVRDFVPTRSQKRILNRNDDIQVFVGDRLLPDTDYPLYRRYIEARHRDGDMYPPTPDQFVSFLASSWGVTRYARFLLNQQLVAVAVLDVLDDGLSAIYTFFDPNLDQRSLGTYAILWQIEEARRRALDYVYLGYWVQDCAKMSYKVNFRPIELYINDDWQVLN